MHKVTVSISYDMDVDIPQLGFAEEKFGDRSQYHYYQSLWNILEQLPTSNICVMSQINCHLYGETFLLCYPSERKIVEVYLGTQRGNIKLPKEIAEIIFSYWYNITF